MKKVNKKLLKMLVDEIDKFNSVSVNVHIDNFYASFIKFFNDKETEIEAESVYEFLIDNEIPLQEKIFHTL